MNTIKKEADYSIGLITLALVLMLLDAVHGCIIYLGDDCLLFWGHLIGGVLVSFFLREIFKKYDIKGFLEKDSIL